METSRYAFFWGCQVPARLPFMEKATRLVLSRLGVEYQDLDGFTCCPEKALVKSYSHLGWELTAARNLALAEQAGLDIVTGCNGCYGTLRGVALQLQGNSEQRRAINQHLAAIGLQFKGDVQVKHLIELFHDDLSPARIKQAVVKPLTGMQIAVHPGCHMTRPSNAIHFDDPLDPRKYDMLIQALGATSVDYDTKMLCCGGGLANIGEAEDGFALTRRKLMELAKRQADALSLICPSCFLQYDQKQYLAQKQGEGLNTPVITYQELLGLAMGCQPAELGLEHHRVDVDRFLQRWEQQLVQRQMLEANLDLAATKRCYACGACVPDCPAAENGPRFRPQEIIGLLLQGKVDELVRAPEIWMCLECHTCYELCPQKFGMEKVFTTLKNLAFDQGVAPGSMSGAIKTFLTTGRLAAADARARKKLDLGPVASDDSESLRKLWIHAGLVDEE